MKRPVAVTVFGILNIVFAGVGVFGMLASIVIVFANPMGAARNPVVVAFQNNPTYAAWMKASIPLAVLSCAALLAAGIGLLVLKEWARKLSIGWAIYAIAMQLVNLVIGYSLFVKPLIANAAPRPGPEAAAAFGAAVGVVLGGCLGSIYPVVLLIFMTRPNIKAVFLPPTEPTELPPDW